MSISSADSFDPAEIEAQAAATGYGAPEDEADAFEIGEVSGFAKTADQIEEESSFDDIPPGEWKLRVVGFLSAPKKETKAVYLAGQRTSYTAHSIVVKLARADVPGQQVTDFFMLPPDDPREWPAYFHGSNSPEGKGAGFNANKFFHFIERLGYVVPKGGGLPPEARRLGNWKGRQVVAKVEPGRPYHDATTGVEKPGRNQVKLFSYRPADAPAAGAAPQATAGPAAGSVASRRGPSGEAQMQMAGLDNI